MDVRVARLESSMATVSVTKVKMPMMFDSAIKGRNVQLSSDLRTATRTRCIDETPTKCDLLSIKETLDQKLQSLHQIEAMDVRVARLERSMATVSVTKVKMPMTFDSEIKGRKVELSSDLRTATRTRPTENSGYYGGVVSKSPLEDDEVFQIKIEEKIDTWSEYYGIGIGVIEEKNKNERIKDETSILLNIKGTWGIFSNSWAQTGKCHIWKDGSIITENGYPLPTHGLPVGTILGVSKRSDGSLHFYLNGVDKGAAFRNVPKDVYAFVDVRDYVTKISITS